jgi:hypothetical protein
MCEPLLVGGNKPETNPIKKMKITKHQELIEILASNGETHLHIERDCGTHHCPFYLSDSEGQEIASGEADMTQDEEGEIEQEIAWALFQEKESFDSATSYFSLISKREPQEW